MLDSRVDLMRWVFGACFLFAIWLLMSGVYKPLTIGLGAGSAVFATYMVWRMERASAGARLTISQKPIATLGYLIWLLKEIAKSNWLVTKAIMSPDMGLRQHFFKVPFSQRTDLGQTIFANSITLTPGTITVEVEPDFFWVHSVCFGDDDHDALAEMNARVAGTERA